MKELIEYSKAPACAFLIDLSTLWAFVHFLALGYLSTATMFFLSGSVVVYQISTKIAFNQQLLTSCKAEFEGFVAIGGLGLLADGMIYVCAILLGLHYPIAKCVAAAVTVASNFVLRRQMLFVHRAAF